jgi:hypothetical protein
MFQLLAPYVAGFAGVVVFLWKMGEGVALAEQPAYAFLGREF